MMNTRQGAVVHGWRRHAALAGVAAAAALVTACGTTHHSPASAAGSAVPGAGTSTAGSVAPGPPPGSPSGTPAVPATATARSAADASSSPTATPGCPVAAQTLLTALRADNTGLFSRAGKPAALDPPTCYRGYSVARTTPDGQHQPARVLFQFDAATLHWRPIDVGSGGFCTGVPADVVAHLPGC
jgi:hypothetical protein